MTNYVSEEFKEGDILQFYIKDVGHLPLSNFWQAEFVDQFENVWKTVEHFYQASKCLHDEDWHAIKDAKTPNLAKKMGRVVDLRSDWEEVKLSIMREALSYKFAEGTWEANFLILTTGYLREGNWWGDRFWGTDMNGNGQNWLGWLLMAQRDYLRTL